MKVKEESEKVGLKLNIQKMKIMASGPITSWEIGNNFKMPGRSTSSSGSGSTGFISFSGVESALSSLKNFQSCISSGMDTASSVALDLVETQTEVSSEYSMDKAMVEFAMMDRELNHYLKAVQSTINHVKEERSEKIPDLKLLVEKKFLALQNKNSDADFQNNEKFVQFKQQLKELKKQCKSACFALVWLFIREVTG
uniref:NSE2 (MMS21) homolog, SMC5-SMC6 complex SUMO ligase n=1 Tax=Ovis aries TaxID=9940 RepID=A0AC11BE55_SHEEP